jgi:hypothetical protein
MTPGIVPYQFSWPDTQVEFPHLEFIDVPGGKKVSWNLVGASLFVPDCEWSPSREDIEANNKGSFKAHGVCGSSVTKYHEFFITFPYSSFRGEVKPTSFRMSNIEATFGLAIPARVLSI